MTKKKEDGKAVEVAKVSLATVNFHLTQIEEYEAFFGRDRLIFRLLEMFSREYVADVIKLLDRRKVEREKGKKK